MEPEITRYRSRDEKQHVNDDDPRDELLGTLGDSIDEDEVCQLHDGGDVGAREVPVDEVAEEDEEREEGNAEHAEGMPNTRRMNMGMAMTMRASR